MILHMQNLTTQICTIHLLDLRILPFHAWMEKWMHVYISCMGFMLAWISYMYHCETSSDQHETSNMSSCTHSGKMLTTTDRSDCQLRNRTQNSQIYGNKKTLQKIKDDEYAENKLLYVCYRKTIPLNSKEGPKNECMFWKCVLPTVGIGL